MKTQLAIYSGLVLGFLSVTLLAPSADGQKPTETTEQVAAETGDVGESKPLVQEDLASAVAEEITVRTNAFRKEKGLDELKTDEDLRETAKQFAAYMAQTDRYGHYADGRTPAQRAKAAGYEYCVVRENIAYKTNPLDPSKEGLIETFVQGWIDSPEHRENMLAEYVTETAAAVATTDGETFFAVQMFGRPKSESIKIEIAHRGEENVTLLVESNDSEDEIDLEPRMRLRMTRCFPTQFSLKSSDEKLKVDSDAQLVVADGQLSRE